VIRWQPASSPCSARPRLKPGPGVRHGLDARGYLDLLRIVYAHAVLWNGQGREAAQVLYDFARHASPPRVWREEQKPVGKGNEEVGDMPHNWASASSSGSAPI